MRKTVIFKLWAQVATFVMLVTSIQVVSIKFAPPAQAAQADLTASVGAPGAMEPPAFGDLITETFDNFGTGVSSALAAGTVTNIGTISHMTSGTVTAQSGGTNASPTNTTYTLSLTDIVTRAAEVWGGAGGTGRYASANSTSAVTTNVGGVQFDLPDLSPTDDTYRYVGFWWSAGNSPNIVRLMNNGSETAVFTTTNLISQLGTAPATPVRGDYFGNPSSVFNSDGGDCPSGTTCISGGSSPWGSYAYIHLRLSTGFDQIQFIGRGFEFDSVSIRRFVPPSSADETSIVGSGVVSNCSAFSNQNAQYVLRNGSFEDDYFVNSTGTTSAPLANLGTSNDNNSVAAWLSYVSGPYQVMNLYDATSSNANRIPFWQTTATDDKIELQRQVAGSAASATNNGASYFDLFGPRPADGSVHAEINATQKAALFQDIVTIGGQRITWSIKHRGRYFGSGSTTQASSTTTDDRDKFEILIGPSSGTLAAQTPARRRSPDVVWNTSDATYANNAFTTFTTTSSEHTAGTMYTKLEDGWVLYTGTYTVPTGQTSTRFSFSSRGTGTVGNLIDDIGFDPIIACPRTVTIQANVDANYPMSPLLESQIPSYTYPDTTTVSAVSINGGSGTATLSQSQIQLRSNTVGSYQVLYTLTDVNTQTSQSTITVNVEDAETQLPEVLLVDPRATSVSLPSQTISGSTNAMLCIEQVDNASATTLTGSPSISVSRSSDVSNVTFTSATNSWRFTGTRANVQSQVPSINITGVGSNPVVASGSKFVRIGVTAATTMGASVCYTGENKVVELRALDLRGSETKSLSLD